MQVPKITAALECAIVIFIMIKVFNYSCMHVTLIFQVPFEKFMSFYAFFFTFQALQSYGRQQTKPHLFTMAHLGTDA